MTRWVALGLLLGAAIASTLFAPASWLAAFVASASDGRFLLADARGTVWTGSATPVLSGGAGSRDASSLPGRMHWRLRLDGLALRVVATHACCLVRPLVLRVVPGFGTVRVELLADAARAGATGAVGGRAGPVLGQWPASWLVGLGTPWNTLQPNGSLALSSRGLAVESAGGRWQLSGSAVLDLIGVSSRISTLDVLGSYRLTVSGGSGRGAPATLQLTTLNGALQLSGSGQLLGPDASSALRFRGSASAAPGHEAVLNNLLNIIGRRQGATAVIAIG